MESNLQEIFKIQRFLEEINYPDAYRVAREIQTYLLSNKNVSKENLFQELKNGKPWEYIKGDTQFCNLTFKVDSNTLIPRVETEQLVYDCKDLIQKENIKNIIDVGTGSGCIIISLCNLLQSPYSFYATDISQKALNIAKYNEKQILKQNGIKWLNTDLIKDLDNLNDPTLIIANLPYIPTEKYKKLDKSVIDYEPQLALDGGKDGLRVYEKLFKQIKSKNINVKVIYFETEASIFEESINLVKEYFPKSKITKIKDCFNRNRFIKISL